MQAPDPCLIFPLFNLPSELRVRIYEYVLAPSGVLCLNSTSSKRCAVDPIATPALLATSRRIHRECSDILYAQNEICIAVSAHDTRWPAISEKRLPQPVLARVQHMCVILDCTNYFNASYADVDLAAFEALVALKTLRISMVYRENYPSQRLAPLHIPQLREYNVVAQVLERVPASTKLSFGTVAGSQESAMVWRILDGRARAVAGKLVEARPESLEEAAHGVKGLVRGCKSGRTRDVFAESRSIAGRNVPQRI